MDTVSQKGEAGRRLRRNHTPELKAQVVAACSLAGASIASVAKAHGVNASLARRWVRDAKRLGGTPLVANTTSKALTPAFVPVRLAATEPAPGDIRIELRRGVTIVSVSWPSAAASECAIWMRELLR